MKHLLIILLVSGICYPQNKDSLICAERGHILNGISSMTAMYCPPQIIDLPDRTLRIVYDRNEVTQHCQRCGAEVKRRAQEQPDTTIIWKDTTAKVGINYSSPKTNAYRGMVIGDGKTGEIIYSSDEGGIKFYGGGTTAIKTITCDGEPEVVINYKPAKSYKIYDGTDKVLFTDSLLMEMLINKYREFEKDSVYLGLKKMELMSYKGKLIYETVGDISYRWEYSYKFYDKYIYWVYQYRHYYGAGFGEFINWLENKVK